MLNKEAIGNPLPLRSSALLDILRTHFALCAVNRVNTASVRKRARLLLETLHHRELRLMMRSELVFEAGIKIENRFLLATTTMQATRKLHVSATRTEDTVNRVLTEVANGTRMHGKLPEVVPPAVIDVLLITPAA